MINIAELLKDAQKGITLYSPLFGEVEFMEVGTDGFLRVHDKKYGGVRSFDFYGRYFYEAFSDAECLLFPSKDCRTWEGWKLPVKPKFKVGDWIIDKYQLSEVFNVSKVLDHTYEIIDKDGYDYHVPHYKAEEDYRFWTINDAKNGDVLVMEKTPINHESIFIFQKINEASVIHYCYYFNDNGEEVFGKRISNNIIGHTNQSFHPATKEQRNLLFQKMGETGYVWDKEKKELRKITVKPKFKVGDNIKTGNQIDTIAEVDHATRSYYCESGRTIWFENQDLWHLVPKPHYDISNFKPFQKVLVRDEDDGKWMAAFYSHYMYEEKDYPYQFATIGTDIWGQCIHFEGNECLLGTTDMCPEEYINW